MEQHERCPGIDGPCSRAGRWVWTHRTGTPERYCLSHVTTLLATLADEVATRMEASTARMEARTAAMREQLRQARED